MRKPRERFDNGRQSQLAEPGRVERERANAGGGPAALAVQVDSEPAVRFKLQGRIGRTAVAELFGGVRGQRWQHDRFDGVAIKDRRCKRLHRSVESDGRRNAGDEVKVAAAQLSQKGEPRLEARAVRGQAAC